MLAAPGVLTIQSAGEYRARRLTKEHFHAWKKELGPALDDRSFKLTAVPNYRIRECRLSVQ
eukprot:4186288-Prymnesium_polylepis.1